MAFIGTPLDTRNTFQSLQGKRFNGDGSTTAFTLDVAPSSTLDIEVFVGNVRQDPNSAYTLSGTTLTFTGAPPSGTNNIYVVHQAKSVGTIDPPATISTAQTFSSTLTANGGAVFNEDSADVDFRVESNGSAYAISVDAGNDTLGLFSASATQGADVQIGFHDTVTTATAMGTAHANDATLLLGGANSGATQGSIYLGGQNISANGVEGAVYGFSGGSQNVGIEFLEGTGDAYGQISMKVGQGTGGTLVEAMKIDSAGHVTHPLTTAFKVTQTGALSVADGHTLFSGNTTEVKDVNADFSGGTFTAPVDGFYYISASVLYQDLGSGDTDTIEDTFTFSNGNEIISRAGKLNNALSSGGYFMSNNATISYMDANDTLTCTHSDGGTLVVHANAHASHFEGFLLG